LTTLSLSTPLSLSLSTTLSYLFHSHLIIIYHILSFLLLYYYYLIESINVKIVIPFISSSFLTLNRQINLTQLIFSILLL
jgi:hypothetical protein